MTPRNPADRPATEPRTEAKLRRVIDALEFLAEAENDLDVIVPKDIAERKGESIRAFIERMRA